jgi:hypothetical protein
MNSVTPVTFERYDRCSRVMAKKWLSFIGSYCDLKGMGSSRISHVPDECYKKIICPKMVFTWLEHPP